MHALVWYKLIKVTQPSKMCFAFAIVCCFWCVLLIEVEGVYCTSSPKSVICLCAVFICLFFLYQLPVQVFCLNVYLLCVCAYFVVYFSLFSKCIPIHISGCLCVLIFFIYSLVVVFPASCILHGWGFGTMSVVSVPFSFGLACYYFILSDLWK